MKSKSTFLFVFVLSIMMIPMLAFAPFGLVQSSPPTAPLVTVPDPLGVILAIAIAFGSLIGTAALVTVLVQIGKLVGFISDGTSSIWAAWLNLGCFIVLVLLGIFRPDLTLDFLDGYAGRIAQVLIYILGFIVQIMGSKPIYVGLKSAGVPLLGFTLSRRPAG